MDAYGNLTSQDEFSNGRRIRLISYLGTDLALGAPATDTTVLGIPVVSGSVSLHHLSSGDPEQTVLIANAAAEGFTLSPSGAPDAFLFAPGLEPPYDQRTPVQLAAPDSVTVMGFGPPVFAVQFVQGCWFTIGPPGSGAAFDVCAGATDEGTEILSFPLNGDQNQIWRAEVVQDGLGATARLGSPPPLARFPVSGARPSWAARLLAFVGRLFGRAPSPGNAAAPGR